MNLLFCILKCSFVKNSFRASRDVCTFVFNWSFEHLTQKMNCIIIDDDLFALRLMERFLQTCNLLKHVKSFDNGFDAITYLNNYQNTVGLIFLDIEMPEMNGLEFLQSLILPPAVIIISSKPEYAAQAYDLPILDYVLKPFTYERLNKAVDRVIEKQNRTKMNSLFGRDEHLSDCNITKLCG